MATTLTDLEQLLARHRRATSALIEADGADRWGGGGDAGDAFGEQLAARQALEALVGTLRAEAPAMIAAWADAHLALLAGILDDDVRPYADDARAGWAEVKAGARAFVEESRHLPIDRARYRELFGFEP